MLLKNGQVGCAEDFTLFCRISHPRGRAFVAASLNDDLAMISDWCCRWGICCIKGREGYAYFSFSFS